MNLATHQIRAARALLGWSQDDVCRLTGLSRNGLSDLEQGKVSPRAITLEKLRRVFEAHGIEFLDEDGARIRRDPFKVVAYEGKKAFADYFQDLVEVSRHTKMTGYHHADDIEFSRTYPNEFFWYYSQMVKYNLKERLIIPDTKLFRYAPLKTTECRLCPRDVFGTVGYSVYGDKLALYMPNRLVVIENKEVADTYRKQFEFDWKRSTPLPSMTPLYEKELKKRSLLKS